MREDLLPLAREARDKCQALVDELMPDPFRSVIPGLEEMLIALSKATDCHGLRIRLTPQDLLPYMDEIIKLVSERRD